MNDEALAGYLIRLLLRYFRKGDPQFVTSAEVKESDRDLLLLQWSASEQVGELCTYVLEHPHELRSALWPRVTMSAGRIRGRIRSADSARIQISSGDPSLFVYEEPFRSFDAGPNRVLGWTLSYATQLAVRFRALLPLEATYRWRIVDRLRLLEEVRRSLPAIIGAVPVPSAGDVRAARAARQLLYRKAASAYDFLSAIERLHELAIEDLLMRTLIGPMERWRQFELALALSMATAVAARTSSQISLRSILPGTSGSIIDIGPYAVRWQQPGPGFTQPQLSKWEIREVDILAEYGVSPGYDRPDVVMFDRRSNTVVAVGEAKYFDSADWKDRLRDAVTQLVTYCRGYANQQDVDKLLGRSLIALWTASGTVPDFTSMISPTVTTFAEMQSGLVLWADRAIASAGA